MCFLGFGKIFWFVIAYRSKSLLEQSDKRYYKAENKCAFVFSVRKREITIINKQNDDKNNITQIKNRFL